MTNHKVIFKDYTGKVKHLLVTAHSTTMAIQIADKELQKRLSNFEIIGCLSMELDIALASSVNNIIKSKSILK